MTSVLVDGRSLGGDGAYRGFGRYLRNVLEQLVAREELALSALVEEGASLPDGIERVTVRRRAPGRFAHIEHDLLLPREIRRHGAAVFHSPGHDPPRRCDRPWVQTLHDVIPLVIDDPGYASARRRWRTLAERMRTATAVLTNSRHTADQGIATLGLDPARVHVASMGVDDRFVPPADPSARSGDEPYVLLVAEHGPNKGYADAFAVAAGLADRGLPHRLRVVGRLAPWVRPTVEALRAAAPHPDRVELLGWVPDEQLIALYQGAIALIVTSRAEGFCLPAAEAMTCATPVVAYDNTALPEVIADGGTLVPDGAVDQIVAEVAALAADPARMVEASARALSRAAVFRWDRVADVHAEIYRAVADRA
jgi:glycosyltransferase involved in cell wall biosynthesis